MDTTILQTNNLTVRFGKHTVLDNINIELKEKHIYGFIGENGAGKTTLMRVLTGLLYPSDGEFSLFGKNGQPILLKCVNISAVPLKPLLYIPNTPLGKISNYSVCCWAIQTQQEELTLKRRFHVV